MIELMRERIMIQKSSTKTDKTGNHTLVWSDHYKCYSYVNNLSGKEYWEAKQVNAETEPPDQHSLPERGIRTCGAGNQLWTYRL